MYVAIKIILPRHLFWISNADTKSKLIHIASSTVEKKLIYYPVTLPPSSTPAYNPPLLLYPPFLTKLGSPLYTKILFLDSE